MQTNKQKPKKIPKIKAILKGKRGEVVDLEPVPTTMPTTTRSRPCQEDQGEEIRPARGQGSYVQQKVRCGDPKCHCAKADGKLHGPYWYLFTKKDGKERSKYIGKNLPAAVTGGSQIPPGSRRSRQQSHSKP